MDTLKAKCDSLEKRDITTEIATAVKARIDLLDKAKPYLTAEVITKLDTMDDTAVRTAVIVAKCADFKADGKSADYINARFDSVVELFKGEAIAGQRTQSSIPAVGHADGCGSEDAGKKMRERAMGAWKDKPKNA